jgi:ATP-binding cassette subfamily B protein
MRKEKKNGEDANKLGFFKIIKRLIQYIGSGNKKLLLPLFIFTVSNIIISWFTPLIFRSLVDDGLGGGIGVIEGDIEIVMILGTIFFVLTIIGVLVRIAQGYIISKMATLTMYNLRHELFDKFQKLGLDYHESPEQTTGKKINYITSDINTIQQWIQSGLVSSVSNIFLIFGAIVFMIMLSPILTLILFMVIPLFFGVAGLLLRKARKYFDELRERIANVTSTLDESIMGMRIIQSFAVEENNYKEFNQATQLEQETTMKSAKLMAFIPGILMIFLAVGIIAVLFSSGILIREGSLTQGSLIAFIFYLVSFFEPLLSLIGFMTLLQNSIAAGSRVIQILERKTSIDEPKNANNIQEIKGRIEYSNVDFSYEEDIPILKSINININEEERLALVGYTGAGKSTFIKLLSRFYDPTEGEIKIDGINIKNMNIKSLRSKLGIVLQENFLFSGSIKDNIRYGKLNATDEEIEEIAKKVRVHEYIMALRNGYDTIVGERGSRLSEGQKQLIAFARALIADPPILILDEATSSIDPYSELLIQQALETLMKGRTSISIAHRLSTIINSDRIIVLDKGQIIEQGSHQELVELDGFYNHLYKMQFKDPFKK